VPGAAAARVVAPVPERVRLGRLRDVRAPAAGPLRGHAPAAGPLRGRAAPAAPPRPAVVVTRDSRAGHPLRVHPIAAQMATSSKGDVSFARRRLSRVRYEDLSDELRRRYPIDELWDASARRLRGRPFRISRVREEMVAIFDGDIRFRVVDVRCACIFFLMLRESHDGPERVRHIAHAYDATQARATREPSTTVALRHAAAAHRRRAFGLHELVRARTGCVEDGAEWRPHLETVDASSLAINPPVLDVRRSLRRA